VWIVTPFTGAGPDGTVPFLLSAGTRYALLGFFLGAALAAAVLPGAASYALAGIAFVYDIYKILKGTSARVDLHVGSKVAAAIVVLSLAGVALAWIWPRVREHLHSLEQPAASRTLLAGGVIVMWLISAGVINHIDGARTPSQLQRALDGYRHRPGSMIVIGVGDMRSVLGDRLDAPIASVQGGKRKGDAIPYTDAAALTLAIDRTDASVLVVPDKPNGINIPSDWAPSPRWRKVAQAQFTTIYAR
jgi:hypothetical protein